VEFLDYVVLIKNVLLGATPLVKATFNQSVWWGCVTWVRVYPSGVDTRSGLARGFSRHKK
jgi:hypothetical protein